MKKLIVLASLLALSGCTTNGVYDSKKTWLLIGGVVTGVAISSKSSSKTTAPCTDAITFPNDSNIHVAGC